MTGHGATNVEELLALGLTEADILDLSVNVVPFDVPPAIRAVIDAWDPRAYPDPTCIEARTALASHLRVPLQRVVLGNGATELMWTLFDVVCPRTVLVLEPTFSEFRAAAEAKGVKVLSAHDPEGVWPTVDAPLREAQIVYFTHPNNPTGRRGPFERVTAWAHQHPNTLFVADESFLSLSTAHKDLYRPLPDNVLRLRSLTKDYGLASLRIGYAIAPETIVANVDAVRPPWTVNGLAQAALPAALSVESSLGTIRTRLFAARDHLVAALHHAGFETIPSETIFVMVKVGNASATKARLLKQHAIRVRDCTNFGMPQWIRVAAREGEATPRLVTALSEATP